VAVFRILPYIMRSPRVLQELSGEGDSSEEEDSEEEEEEKMDIWDSDEDMLEDDDDEHEVDDEPWGFVITLPDERKKEEDAILPLNSHFFGELESQGKTAEYRNYHMPEVKRLWFMNTETHMITHMAEVEGPQEHQDLKLDGSKKRQWKYPIIALYSLDQPTTSEDQRLIGSSPSGPVFQEKSFSQSPLTMVWSKSIPGKTHATGDS